MSDEYKDKKRSLTSKIKSWVHYKSTPETHERTTINSFNVTSYEPFDNNRDEWEKEAAYSIIDKLTAAMLTEFKSYGITQPNGKNIGSFDWNFEIIDSEYEIKETKKRKATTLDRAQLKMLEKSIKNFNKQKIKYVKKIQTIERKIKKQEKAIQKMMDEIDFT